MKLHVSPFLFDPFHSTFFFIYFLKFFAFHHLVINFFSSSSFSPSFFHSTFLFCSVYFKGFSSSTQYLSFIYWFMSLYFLLSFTLMLFILNFSFCRIITNITSPVVCCTLLTSFISLFSFSAASLLMFLLLMI